MQSLKPNECPHCHSKVIANFFKEGFKWLSGRKVQRWRCKACGRVFHQ